MKNMIVATLILIPNLANAETNECSSPAVEETIYTETECLAPAPLPPSNSCDKFYIAKEFTNYYLPTIPEFCQIIENDNECVEIIPTRFYAIKIICDNPEINILWGIGNWGPGNTGYTENMLCMVKDSVGYYQDYCCFEPGH